MKKRQQMIKSNPRSKSVQVDGGTIFPSLSEADEHFGFVGLPALIYRIKKGVWKYT